MTCISRQNIAYLAIGANRNTFYPVSGNTYAKYLQAEKSVIEKGPCYVLLITAIR